MKLQSEATQIASRTAHLLEKAVYRQGNAVRAIQEPAWFRVVAANPPTHDLVNKTVNYKEFVTNRDQKDSSAKKFGSFVKGKYVTRNKNLGEFRVNAKHLYRMRPIQYQEDRIRKLFYNQHPWELSRPRLMVENAKKDYESVKDWSSMVQSNKALDGESVVQRTMYLYEQELKKDPSIKSWLPFYDQARLEFYRLRMREEAEIQVAAEEAAMFGGVFGKSAIEQGIEEEQRFIDKWTVEAEEATKLKRSRLAPPEIPTQDIEEPSTSESS